MSETESPTMDFEDDTSTTSTRGSESPITTDNETETDEEENDPWMPMVEEAMQKHKSAFVENDDFAPEEAMEAAVDKRKFLIKKLLKDYSFTKDSDDEDN